MATPKSSRWLLTLLTFLGLTVAVAGPSVLPASAQDGGSRRDGGGEGRREGRGRFRRDSEERNRDEKPATPTPPSVAKPSSSSSTASPSMDMNDYAKDLIKKYDKNSDFMLQADEQRELRGKAATADLDKDGTITREELVAHLSATVAPGSAPASGNDESSKSESRGEERNRSEDSGRNRGRSGASDERSEKPADGKNVSKRVFTGSISGDSSKSEKASKRSFRFTPSAERLPTGLPDWFTSKDKDSDGQVSMREYNRSWSDRTAAEFRRYDLDNDGMITAKEAAKNKKGE